ncbi:MAG: hypothetical protein ACRC5H_03320 [Treponemataceae bacterium]
MSIYTESHEEFVDECYLEQEITCPHCMHVHENSFSKSDFAEKVYCDFCSKPFSYERNTEVTYNSKKINDDTGSDVHLEINVTELDGKKIKDMLHTNENMILFVRKNVKKYFTSNKRIFFFSRKKRKAFKYVLENCIKIVSVKKQS